MSRKFDEERCAALEKELEQFLAASTVALHDRGAVWIISKEEQSAILVVLSMLSDCHSTN